MFSDWINVNEAGGVEGASGSDIITDPFIEEEVVNEQLVEDTTTFTLPSKFAATDTDYAILADQTSKNSVMRISWVHPIDLERANGTDIITYTDSRGRLIRPVSYTIRAKNLSSNPVKWHINTPMQAAVEPGLISARSNDVVLTVGKGASRTYQRKWEAGQLAPLCGSIRLDIGNNNAIVPASALADCFFVTDDIDHTTNAAAPSTREFVELHVKVKYERDPYVEPGSTTERRSPLIIQNLNKFEAVYHVDPVYTPGLNAPRPVLTFVKTPNPLTLEYHDGNMYLVKSKITGSDRFVKSKDIYGIGTADAVLTIPELNIWIKQTQQDTGLLYCQYIPLGDGERKGSYVLRVPKKLTSSTVTPTTYANTPVIAVVSCGTIIEQRPVLRRERPSIMTYEGVEGWVATIMVAIKMGTIVLEAINAIQALSKKRAATTRVTSSPKIKGTENIAKAKGSVANRKVRAKPGRTERA